METITYTLPEHWACALINDDATGLSDDEHEQLNEWLQDYKPGSCLGVSDSPEFRHHHDATDAGVLACDCLTFTFETGSAT